MAFADDWDHWARHFPVAMARGWRDFLDDIAGLAAGGAYDYDDISGEDAATDVTGAELEELTDGSETTLHTHASLESHGCKVYGSSATTITTGNWADLANNSEIFDTDTLHDTSTNNERITVPSALYGLWSFSAAVLMVSSSGASGQCRITIVTNNGYTVADQTVDFSGVESKYATISGTYAMDATDSYVTLYCRNTTGQDVDFTPNDFSAYFIGTI